MQHLYLTDLAPAEAAVGFAAERVDNPAARHQGHPAHLTAVVLHCSPSYRLVKMRHPTKQKEHFYSLERYAAFLMTPSEPPAWEAVWSPYHERDPDVVVQETPAWIAAHPNPHFEARIPPAPIL